MNNKILCPSLQAWGLTSLVVNFLVLEGLSVNSQMMHNKHDNTLCVPSGWCQVQEGNSLLFNGFSETIHRQYIEEIWGGKLKHLFIPQSANYPLKMTIWSNMNHAQPALDRYWEEHSMQAFHLTRKKDTAYSEQEGLKDNGWKPKEQATYVLQQRRNKGIGLVK